MINLRLSQPKRLSGPRWRYMWTKMTKRALGQFQGLSFFPSFICAFHLETSTLGRVLAVWRQHGCNYTTTWYWDQSKAYSMVDGRQHLWDLSGQALVFSSDSPRWNLKHEICVKSLVPESCRATSCGKGSFHFRQRLAAPPKCAVEHEAPAMQVRVSGKSDFTRTHAFGGKAKLLKVIQRNIASYDYRRVLINWRGDQEAKQLTLSEKK